MQDHVSRSLVTQDPPWPTPGSTPWRWNRPFRDGIPSPNEVVVRVAVGIAGNALPPRPVHPPWYHQAGRTLDIFVRDLTRRPRARGIDKTIEPHLHQPASPLAHPEPTHAEFLSDVLVTPILSTKQDDARTQRQPLRRLWSPCPSAKLSTLFIRDRQRCEWSAHGVATSFTGDPHRTANRLRLLTASF